MNHSLGGPFNLSPSDKRRTLLRAKTDLTQPRGDSGHYHGHPLSVFSGGRDDEREKAGAAHGAPQEQLSAEALRELRRGYLHYQVAPEE